MTAASAFRSGLGVSGLAQEHCSRADLWQCGSNLIGANGGIVTYSLEKWKEPLVSPSVNGAKLEGLDGARIIANRPLILRRALSGGR
jgi:hypothetical protein